jgi:hypothetical protein
LSTSDSFTMSTSYSESESLSSIPPANPPVGPLDSSLTRLAAGVAADAFADDLWLR